MAKKPLRISDDVNDLQNIEFGDDELAGIGGLDIGNLGTHTVNRNGDNMQFTDPNAGGPWTLLELLQGNGRGSLVLTYTDQSGNPFLETSSGTYQSVCEFIFPGSSTVGNLEFIKILFGSASATNQASCRLYDVTNGQALSESLPIWEQYQTCLQVKQFGNFKLEKLIMVLKHKYHLLGLNL